MAIISRGIVLNGSRLLPWPYHKLPISQKNQSKCQFLNFASDNNLLTAEKGVNIKTGGLVKEIEFSADFPCHPLS